MFIGLVTYLFIFSCQAQVSELEVGGRCEGCEALLEYGTQKLQTADTLPYFNTTSEPLILTGTVYKADGTTPAKDVIVYAYHTDENGIYITDDNSAGWERRHGFLRGWVRTGEDGTYAFYTNRPASYPNTNNPQHIHLTVKEPGMISYYIDAIHFLDDPLLNDDVKSSLRDRGGSGLVMPEKSGNTWMIQRDIILGENIPDHPDS